jgi:hypothetical protein
MSATEVLTVRTVLTIGPISAATVAPAPPVSKSILSTVALVVAILPGILLRLSAAARNKRRKTTDILSAFVTTLARLWVGLLLLMLLMMLRAILDLLIARWKRLCVTRQIRLLLWLARPIARLVLAHKGLVVVVIAIIAVVTTTLRLSAWRTAALLMRLLLVVVRVLLTKLFLRCRDQAEVVFGVLIIILGGHRVARPLRVTRELDVFFRDMRSGAPDFDVGTVRFVNAREGILALAVVASPPHALLTVSHVVPVRRPFTLSRHSRRTLNCKSKQISLRGRTCVMSAPMTEMSCPYRVSRSNPIAAASAAVLPTSCYAHRSRFRKMMRPTGEASRPVSGDFVCRLFAAGSSSSALRRISQSRFAPEFLAMQPSRVDSVTGS